MYDEALKIFEQAIQRDPKLSQVKQYYGATLYAKYHLAREEEYARKALEAFRQIYEEGKQKASSDKEATSNVSFPLNFLLFELMVSKSLAGTILPRSELVGGRCGVSG